MTKTIAFAALALAAATVAPAAMAQDDDHMPSATVAFADINLNSNTGVDLLDRRIRSAAREVCGQPESNTVFGAPVRRCIRETIAAAQGTRDQAIAAARSGDETHLAATSFEVRRAG